MNLNLALKRRKYLRVLTEHNMWKRDLVQELPDSRSTVNRSISELTEAGLVIESSSGYTATQSGRVLLATVEDSLDISSTIESESELLNNLPHCAPVAPEFFIGVHVAASGPPSPIAAVEGIHDVLANAEEVRGVSIADNDTDFVDTLYTRSVELGELDMDLLLERNLAHHIVSHYPEMVAKSFQTGNISIGVVDDVPYTIYLMTEDGQTTAFLIVHGDSREFLGYLSNDSEPAVEWATSVYESFLDSATPLQELTAEHPDWPTVV